LPEVDDFSPSGEGCAIDANESPYSADWRNVGVTAVLEQSAYALVFGLASMGAAFWGHRRHSA
jgi:hypothetical protein